MAILFSKNTFAVNPDSVDYQVNISPSLNISVTSGGVATNNVTLNLNPNSKTYDSSTIDVKVSTNNVTGYNLSMTTSNNDNKLVKVDDNTKYIETLDNATSESNFPANKWGYRVSASDTNPSKVTSNYFPFNPDPNLAVNHYATNGDITSLTFAAKIDWNQPAGTYENTLVFNAVATYAAYTINYYDGVDNTTGNEIATQENDYNTSSTVLLNPIYTGGATEPTRSGLSGDTYTFLGWCDEIPGGETTEGYFKATTCPSGHQHPAGSTITIDPEQYTTNINLYAYWDPTTFAEAYQAAGATSTMSATPTSGSAKTAYIMQNMTSNICHNVTVGEYEFLGDNRSGNYGYYVAKLKDDKCWMVQNLRLGTNFSTSTTLALTPDNTDITSNYTFSGKRPSPGQMQYTSCATGSCEDRYTSVTYYYDANNFYCSPATSDSTKNYYQGCYYNWWTATASAGKSSVTPVGSGVGYKDVNVSICPKGWKLPTGGGQPLSGSTSDRPNSDFNVLYNNYPSSDLMRNTGTCTASGGAGCDNASGTNTPGFLLSGYYYSGGALRLGESGYYWSRSAYSMGLAYDLNLNSSAVFPPYANHKYNGLSVRCVAYGS